MSTTLNFNLRKPNSKRATQIYAVIASNGKQYKIPIDCKINPWEWDTKGQRPKPQAENAKAIINIITQCYIAFNENFMYFCNKNNVNNLEFIKEQIYKGADMKTTNKTKKNNTRTPKATELLRKAWETYKERKGATLTEGTKKVNEDYLKRFIEYCERIEEDKITMLTKRGISEYQNQLLKQKELSNSLINKLCMWVVKMINNVLACNANFTHYNIVKVDYDKLTEVKRKQEENIHQPLTEEEVNAIENAEGLNAREQEIRDLFIMQINVGCRQSDLWRIFDTDSHKADGKYITFNTQKENITAQVPINDTITRLQTKYAKGFKYINVKDPNKGAYGLYIKKVATKANLTRQITYKDAKGNTIERPLNKVISSHFARHTFINNMINKGYKPDEVSIMSGHADDEMIRRIYGHIGIKENTAILTRATERIEANNKQESSNNIEELINIGVRQGENDKIREYKEVLAFCGVPYQEYAQLTTSEDLFRLIAHYESKAIEKGYPIEKIKELFNNFCKEDYNKFREILKE